ncbi:hypothetical protein P22_0720 [Propionispora sp. 2/2-37]|uniref:adenosylcobinamide amidohydrolase n=1 Tax=Propionispora sp. 2/2-37 TaxID=1677858 RepID=UPI0006BB74F7|nr:adenosylcobinamide amidohydrolase [Propionispora sp. 2/2-37]CUH94654.1 hypothetical protein P22_0720 [Propionispora sp. 2/2-37]
MEIYQLANGDSVYRRHKSIVIPFAAVRKVLSTSVMNGGYREDLTAVFNHDCSPETGTASGLQASGYEAYMCSVAENMGLNPPHVSGMATAALMDNVAIQADEYKNLNVAALVTGGIEVNGGRVGDPAAYFKPVERSSLQKSGTINIILSVNADMPPGTLARALVTCTEAKTAALQELMAGSKYSSGLATGSGTDQTMIIANPSSPLYLESAGKHSKLGELIGNVVKKAVKEALFKQTGLSPEKQHSLLRRLQRFGVNEEMIWEKHRNFCRNPIDRARFRELLSCLDRQDGLVVFTSLYVHLLDQLNWQLLSPEEVYWGGTALLAVAARQFGVEAPSITGTDMEAYLEAWASMLAGIVEQTVKKESGG